MKTRLLLVIIIEIMMTIAFGITVNAQEPIWREESAWSEGDGFPGNNWAMYLNYSIDSGTTETDLIADFDEYLDIGNITVWSDADSLFVKFEVVNGWQLNETHLDISIDNGDGVPDFPINKGGNPKIGKFSYKNETHYQYPNTTTYIFGITKAWSTGDVVYIAAHAEVALSGI